MLNITTKKESPTLLPTQQTQAPMVNTTPTALDAESRGTQAAAVAYPCCHLQQIPGGTGLFMIKDRKGRTSLLSLLSFAKDVDQCHPPVVHVLNK